LAYLRNSVIVATTQTLCQVLCCALAAYVFSRIRWRGREAVFLVFLSGLLVPSIFTLLPNFVLVRDLGLINTLTGIMLPGLLMTPFTLFFLRQCFMTISTEIDDAAKVDGAGHLRVLFRLILPMSTGPLATVTFLTYIAAWNDYMWPMIVGRDESVKVLTVALGIFLGQTPTGAPDWAGLMAATSVAALPNVILS
jgi:multiple sugar transport system permease protein